ncbi:hypothetical protein BDV96DRAFT_488922 [Lophiotrema nucula]|uniref:NAD(P)-binding protein n=1 Tax=Lophiotrema nucula TaxID=690887 RepID=A0A6A5ZHD5_9PLEO|nr:hypothetical protein BDV96DRAFT_488922 [Lophiotrema nucula]
MAVYLLTGASRGIGLEVAHQLSNLPDSTVITLVRSVSDNLYKLCQTQKNIHVILCDISSAESLARLGASLAKVLYGGVTITHVINNAAVSVGTDSKALKLSAEDLSKCINTNVLGPAKIVETTLPVLAPDALIVNISSGIGSLQLVSDGTIPNGVTAYSISKTALNMLTVHQAQELKGRARVVCLDPGHVKTDMGGDKAIVDVADSAKGILAVLKSLEGVKTVDMQSGRARFYNFRGEEVPW